MASLGRASPHRLAVRLRPPFLRRRRHLVPGVEEGVEVREEVVVGEEEEDGNWLGISAGHRVAILCTRNGSPRGHFTLFLVLQYGHTQMCSTSFPSPMDPTMRIPR